MSSAVTPDTCVQLRPRLRSSASTLDTRRTCTRVAFERYDAPDMRNAATMARVTVRGLATGRTAAIITMWRRSLPPLVYVSSR